MDTHHWGQQSSQSSLPSSNLTPASVTDMGGGTGVWGEAAAVLEMQVDGIAAVEKHIYGGED